MSILGRYTAASSYLKTVRVFARVRARGRFVSIPADVPGVKS